MTPPLKRIVPLCELCRRVHDFGEGNRAKVAWTNLQAYITRYQLCSDQLVFAQSYCDDCRTGHRLAAMYGG